MEETNKEEKIVGEKEKGSGLTKGQIQTDLDTFESNRVVLEQQRLLLDFDKKYYAETLNRKFRQNDVKMKLVLSNIEVLKKELEEAKE